jgi:uncharacterized membrane protein
MEEAIQIFIYVHAASGGIALIAGLVSMIARKGNQTHKKSGLIFFYSMAFSGITAMLISLLPNHRSPFLFAIGIFSLYFVITGKRALNFKKQNPNTFIDKGISLFMILTGLAMIVLPILLTGSIDVILAVFGIVGIAFSIRDLMLFKNPFRLQNAWLKLHLGKMIGGFISAITAFVVVGNYFPGIYGWFIPGIAGSFIITYWTRKVSLKTAPNR